MKKLITLSLIFLSLNGVCQFFQKTFVREINSNSLTKVICKYEFNMDSTFLYEQKNTSLVNGVSQQMIINSFTGTYKIHGDTIKLLSVNGETLNPLAGYCIILDSILNGIMVFNITDERKDYSYNERLRHLKGKWPGLSSDLGYYNEQIDCSKKNSVFDYKQIALVDLKYADTTYYCIPRDKNNSALKFDLSLYSKCFSVLNYLIDIPFDRKDVSNRPCRFDDKGRLIQFCVKGWFEMSSIPTVIGFEYYDNTDLIKSTSVSGPIGIDEKEYKTFKYDNEGRLIEFKFHYYEKGELTHSYKIIYL